MIIVELKLRTNFDSAAMRVFRRAVDIVKQELLSAHVTGRFYLTPRDRHTWRAGSNHSLCLRPSQGKEIRLRVKIDGNGSVWEYALTAQDSTVDIEVVRENLSSNLGHEHVEGHEVVSGPTSISVENCTAWSTPQTTMELNGKVIMPHSDADETVKIVTKSEDVAVPENKKPNPLDVIDQMRNAIVHRTKRLKEISDCQDHVKKLDNQINELVKLRDNQLERIMILEDENSKDKDVLLAEQFSELLTRFNVLG